MFRLSVFDSIIDKYFIKSPRLRSAVTRVIFGNKDMNVTLVGAKLLVNSVLENGYFRAALKAKNSSLFRDEIPVLVTLANFIGNDSVFIDVGANIGIFSVTLSRFMRLYPGFGIIAFEVNPKTFGRLSLNARAHGFVAHNLGLGRSEHEAKFVEGAVSHVTTKVDLVNSYNIRHMEFAAKVVPLGQFCIEKEMIIKIDVEGQELDVLEGARPYFDRHQVKCVFLDGYSDSKCLLFLQSYGFEFFDARDMSPADSETFALLAIRQAALPA